MGRRRAAAARGEYRLEVEGADLSGLALDEALLPILRVAVNGSAVMIAPPIDPVYETGEGQSTLEERYAAEGGGTENAVFFESFYGQVAGCNPRAIDRVLAKRAPR
ncbi:hypothetical protein [Microbacterium sp. KUDC0406]|uniref:hypothetical protein n=1 Tax=Microbacterium sp. KUDC0406 TaxID=2909588 RepID=UPI002E3792CD|nr:hypothetical protein [Microbacterium sp. KUDC0406]